MSRIDTVNLYDSYIQNGFTKEQALGILKGLDETTNGFVTNSEFQQLERRINIHFNYIHVIEVAIFLGIIGLFIK